MNKNILLILMLITYAIPIIYISCEYNNNPTISNIITSDKCKYKILFFMIIMSIFTILYEKKMIKYH